MSKSHSKEMDHHIIRSYSTKGMSRWAIDVVVDWFILISTLSVALLFNHIAFYVLALFIIGNRQHALGILGHEGTHYCLHKNKRLNDFISNCLCFMPLGLTGSGYRAMHFAHHSHTNTEYDPEVMHKSARPEQWELPLSLKNLGFICLKDLAGNSILDYMFIVLNAKPDKKKEYAYLLAMHIGFIATCCALGLYAVPVMWYISLLTTFMMFFRIRVWLEHQGEDHTNRLHLNRIEGALFAPHNIWYHYEHHAFPSVPYYNLDEVRKLMTGQQDILTLKEFVQELSANKKLAA